MTPKEKIVAAIDRNTEAVRSHTRQTRRDSVFYTAALSVISTCLVLMTCCPRLNATPLLPPLNYEIGEPPASPPNPNIQYWYTMDVPGPQGVLPQEVFAPRLVAQVASEPQGVETPEPGTAWMVLAYLGVARACQRCFRRKATKQLGNGDAFQVYCDKCIKWAITARKALEE